MAKTAVVFVQLKTFCTFYYSCKYKCDKSQINILLFKHLWEVAEPLLESQ